jgi:hypothetical protein
MKTNRQFTRWLMFLLLGVLSAGTNPVSAQGTAFNYQGRLNLNGTPANGSFDLTFELFSESNGVSRLGNTFTNLNTPVTNGLFAVILDFGSGIFTGAEVWSQISVRTNSGSAFTRLTPLQPVLPIPYAIMANTASNLLGTLAAAQVSGLLPASQLGGTVPDVRLSANVALLNANQTFTGANSFNNASNTFQGSFIGNGASLTNLSNGFPRTAIWLSETMSNPDLNAAGFFLRATQLGPDWLLVNSAAPWGPRSYFGTVTNIGRMWVLGGLGAAYGRNDVWSSSDGQNWSQVMTNAPWGRRQGHITVVLNETFFVMGGITNDNSDNQVYSHDVWSSQGGTNWFQVTTAARWGPRSYSASVVFNDRIWVLGGIEPRNIFRNDVWYSPDGLNWIVGTTGAPWAGRQGHGAVVFNGKMWMMGGLTEPTFIHTNDVWSSSDGTNWTLVTRAAAWSPRTYFTITMFNGKMWVTGGNAATNPVNPRDVWSSVDGITWTQVTNAAAWTERQGHASLAFNNRLWVLGGLGCSDVWSSQSITNMVGELYQFQKR